ncbi:tyrosine-type recombinase/integrase [Neoroseomonas marina]|uniref:tyrosine-type recombinase/integrase n=1 Tax=Neoroseomonas marina TaxID=1232220 RepID=UPI0030B9B550
MSRPATTTSRPISGKRCWRPSGRPWSRRGGFRRFRAHDLRHTFAIRWLQKGGKLWPLSFHLGHTNIKTTEYYVQWLREHPRG